MSPVLPESPLFEVANNGKKSLRVYIKNLHFNTSEEELEIFLKDYEPTYVLIPSYTIRFSRTHRHRPFGIAYAEFSSTEQALKVVKELNGAQFKDRQINVKLHVPFSPTGKPIFGSRKTNQHQTFAGESNKSNETSFSAKPKSLMKEADDILSAVPGSANIEEIPFTNEPKQSANGELQSIFSKNTIFIGNAIDKTTDKEVREFFKDYAPTQVFIFRGANQRRMQRAISLRQKTVSVLVTLKNEEDLSRAIKELNNRKLNGRSVYLRVAYLSKIEEVFKAARANAIPDKSPPTTAAADEEAHEQRSNTTAETSTLIEMFRETQKKIQNKYKETVEKQTKINEPAKETEQSLSIKEASVA